MGALSASAALPGPCGAGMSLPGHGGDTFTGPGTVCVAEHVSKRAWLLPFHAENPGVSPAMPRGRMVVSLGSRCRLFPASSRPPGADSPPRSWHGGVGAFLPPGLGLPRTAAGAMRAGSSSAPPSALAPLLPGFSRREQPRCWELPRAGPAAPGPGLRLPFQGRAPGCPGGVPCPLGARVTHRAAGTLLQLHFPRKAAGQGSLLYPFSPLS